MSSHTPLKRFNSPVNSPRSQISADDEEEKETWTDFFTDEFKPWFKWKIYDSLFAIALFAVLKRYRLLVPTAKLLQWL